MRPHRLSVLRRPAPRDYDVAASLERLGCEVRESDDTTLGLGRGDTLWILGNALWYPRALRELADTPRRERPFVLVWHSEPLPPPRAAGLPRPRLHLRELAKIALRDRRTTDVYSNARRLRQLAQLGVPDLLVVSTPGRREFLAEQGVAAEYVPLGYEGAAHGRDLGLDRDLDVVFLGALVPRRRRLLRDLAATGVRVYRAGGWSDPDTWGEARTRLLNRTRIFLNLARHPGELPGLRFILGMASRTLVVSEPVYAPGPYVPGRHLVTAPLGALPDAIRHFLAHEDERRAIADAGHALVTRELTMDRSVEQLLELSAQRRASAA